MGFFCMPVHSIIKNNGQEYERFWMTWTSTGFWCYYGGTYIVVNMHIYMWIFFNTENALEHRHIYIYNKHVYGNQCSIKTI